MTITRYFRKLSSRDFRHELQALLPEKQAQHLQQLLLTKGNMTECLQNLQRHLKDGSESISIVRHVLQDCTAFNSHLLQLGVVQPWQLDFGLTNHQHHYSGLYFEIQTTSGSLSSGAKETLAVGGRYDGLVQQFVAPHQNAPHAVGVHFAIAKIMAATEAAIRAAQHLAKSKSRARVNKARRVIHSSHASAASAENSDVSSSIDAWRLSRCDIFVSSMGKCGLAERIDICSQLWRLGLKAEYAIEETMSLEQAATYCRKDGIRWLLILREQQRSTKAIIKVRDILHKSDEEGDSFL